MKKRVVFLSVLVVVWLVVLCLFVNAQEQPAVGENPGKVEPVVVAKEETPLSAWICFRAEVDKHWDANFRYTEVFLTKGNLVPADIYYYDVGDSSYQELGFCVGHKTFSILGVSFWALPYYVITEDSQYFGPCFWVQGSWKRWIFNSLPMYYIPLEDEGIRQFSTCNTYLDYRVNDWLEVGVGGTVYWADTEDDQWKWKLGPNIIIKDPIKLLPGGIGDFNLRFTWDEQGDVAWMLQKTFTF